MADKSTITPERARIIVKGSSMRLYTNNVDGKPWICDSYWATPATSVLTAMLSKYGHDLEPRCYAVDSKIIGTEGEPPNISKIVPGAYSKVERSDEWVKAEFAHLPGLNGRVYTKHGQVIMTAAGHLFAVNVDYLSIITGRVDPFATYDSDSKRDVGLAIYAPASKPMGKPLVVLSTHSRTVTYATHDKPKQVETTVDNRAVLMPVKVA